MAYLSTFAFSEDANMEINNNKQKLHVINPQNTFRPMFIPGTFSFSVTLGILDVNPKEDHKFSFVIYDPDQEEIVKTGELNFPVNNNFDDQLPEESNGSIMNFDFRNVAFRKEGKYNAQVTLDGETIGDLPLFVFAQER